jgi:hypothetical protein
MTGIAVVLAVLFTKTWRINKVLMGANTLRRSMIHAHDVLLPLGLFLSLIVAILIAWTVVAPLTWKAQLYKNGEPGPYRGTCYQQGPEIDPVSYTIYLVLCVIYFVALLLTNYQFWRARRLPSLFNENYYIGITNVVLFECVFAGLPILVAFSDDATTFVLVRSIIESLSCMGILLPLFLPKLIDKQSKASSLRFSRTTTIVWSSVSEFVAGKLRFRAAREEGPQAGVRVSGLNKTRPKPFKPMPQPVSEGGSGAFGVVRVVTRFADNHGPDNENLYPIAEQEGSGAVVGSGVMGDILEPIAEDSGDAMSMGVNEALEPISPWTPMMASRSFSGTVSDESLEPFVV